jgi:hypothetical protein
MNSTKLFFGAIRRAYASADTGTAAGRPLRVII